MKTLSVIEFDVCEVGKVYNNYKFTQEYLENYLDKECRAIILTHLDIDKGISPEDIIGIGQLYVSDDTLKVLGVVSADRIPEGTKYMVAEFVVDHDALPETIPCSDYPVIVYCSNEGENVSYKVTSIFDYAEEHK